MHLEKTSFSKLNSRENIPFIIFGAGDIATKTLRKINKGNVLFIVDNSANLQGTNFQQFEIKKPEEIQKNALIIICSTAISDISAQLSKMGLQPNSDFIASPVLNDLLAIDELEKINTTLYFTSGTVTKEIYGGGLYKLSLKGEEVKIEKLYSGPCYGSVRLQNKIFFIDTDKGINCLNLDSEQITPVGKTPERSRAHGISYNESNNRFYITCSYLDGVLEYDEQFNELRRFHLSPKLSQYGEPMHHCNDNYSIGNSLYVSMFSSSGNWKRDVFDGCIAEFNLETGERQSDVAQGLYMPHNVTMFDGSLHVLDSLPGHLRTNNFSIIGTFPAFTRGITYKKGLYFVGQSKNRNFSKVLGLSNNISIDCGIIIFNPESKVSRFVQLSMQIGEIHSITG